jgi:hypothetical protein
MMSKQQRLYYEQQKKERIKEQLAEYAKQQKEAEDKYRHYHYEHFL